ncbi:MAG: hypothetical protein H6618_03905 [Deltaproteobacteria bacterium]|nr:hypothetical protein [Deltaproteobacteria bacterium]
MEHVLPFQKRVFEQFQSNLADPISDQTQIYMSRSGGLDKILSPPDTAASSCRNVSRKTSEQRNLFHVQIKICLLKGGSKHVSY